MKCLKLFKKGELYRSQELLIMDITDVTAPGAFPDTFRLSSDFTGFIFEILEVSKDIPSINIEQLIKEYNCTHYSKTSFDLISLGSNDCEQIWLAVILSEGKRILVDVYHLKDMIEVL